MGERGGEKIEPTSRYDEESESMVQEEETKEGEKVEEEQRVARDTIAQLRGLRSRRLGKAVLGWKYLCHANCSLLTMWRRTTTQRRVLRCHPQGKDSLGLEVREGRKLIDLVGVRETSWGD